VSRQNWVDDDFRSFRANFTLSLTPSVPLQANLRAVMVPALGKLRRYTGASAALHFFVNPTFRQLHVVACGGSPTLTEILRNERARRGKRDDLTPSERLPQYVEMRLDSIEATTSIFKEQDDEYSAILRRDLLHLMQIAAHEFPDEFAGQEPRSGDLVVVLPLRSDRYPRLGYFVLWSPERTLQASAERFEDREMRYKFQTRLRQIVVRVFTNFYRMAPHTYLPEYYKPATREVTLMCVQIRDFDRISANIQEHRGLKSEAEKASCQLTLIKQFGEIAAATVDAHMGRVDQNWANGLLAVFGEYLDSPDGSPRPGVKRALAAAADMVSRFAKYSAGWLRQDFRIQEFIKTSNRLSIAPSLAVAIEYGPAMFDYFGSSEQRVFVTVGKSVNFVKELAACVGRDVDSPPILLSQPAFAYADEIVTGATFQTVTLPGRLEPTPVYPVRVEDVTYQSRVALT